ncbi:unnamed protein product [Polarella glacialis]|uniref:Serine hydrolase domain-containing protein n=1 Tax=Polarella glacialis TaxID=89957 RepID=A0A813G9H6_POLGL|nr:unnamed protein product [Polarella glacialis]
MPAEEADPASPGCTPCARDGCMFYKTWHQTHCCDACVSHGTHGPRCEKKANPSAQAAADAKKEEAIARSEDAYKFLQDFAPAPGGAAGRKLIVVCLHGITQNCDGFESHSKPLWSQCNDVADFFFPSGPHLIDENHSFCKKQNMKPGPNSRTRTLDGNGDRSKGRDDFTTYLTEFIEKEVPGPVDVLLGYSQGGFTIHQLWQSPRLSQKLHEVRAVIILMSGGDSRRSPPKKLRSLHIMGLQDKIVQNETSENSARGYVNPVVAKFIVDHNGPFKPECTRTEVDILKGLHDFHGSFPRLCDMESE